MTGKPYGLLRKMLARYGIQGKELAEHLGLTQAGVSMLLTARADWKQRYMFQTCDLINEAARQEHLLDCAEITDREERRKAVEAFEPPAPYRDIYKLFPIDGKAENRTRKVSALAV